MSKHVRPLTVTCVSVLVKGPVFINVEDNFLRRNFTQTPFTCVLTFKNFHKIRFISTDGLSKWVDLNLAHI